MPKPWENAEGYPDPTAYAALQPIIREEDADAKRVSSVIGVIKAILNLADFELVNRITIRDKRTGKEYR